MRSRDKDNKVYVKQAKNALKPLFELIGGDINSLTIDSAVQTQEKLLIGLNPDFPASRDLSELKVSIDHPSRPILEAERNFGQIFISIGFDTTSFAIDRTIGSVQARDSDHVLERIALFETAFGELEKDRRQENNLTPEQKAEIFDLNKNTPRAPGIFLLPARIDVLEALPEALDNALIKNKEQALQGGGYMVGRYNSEATDFMSKLAAEVKAARAPAPKPVFQPVPEEVEPSFDRKALTAALDDIPPPGKRPKAKIATGLNMLKDAERNEAYFHIVPSSDESYLGIIAVTGAPDPEENAELYIDGEILELVKERVLKDLNDKGFVTERGPSGLIYFEYPKQDVEQGRWPFKKTVQVSPDLTEKDFTEAEETVQTVVSAAQKELDRQNGIVRDNSKDIAAGKVVGTPVLDVVQDGILKEVKSKGSVPLNSPIKPGKAGLLEQNDLDHTLVGERRSDKTPTPGGGGYSR